MELLNLQQLNKISKACTVGMLTTGALILTLGTLKATAYAVGFFGIHTGGALLSSAIKGVFFTHLVFTATASSSFLWRDLKKGDELHGFSRSLIGATALLVSTFALSKLGPTLILGIATTQIFKYSTLFVISGLTIVGMGITLFDMVGILTEGYENFSLIGSNISKGFNKSILHNSLR